MAHNDDEATAQHDIEALRERARQSKGDRAPEAGADSSPDSFTRTDVPPPRRPSFPDEERTSNDLGPVRPRGSSPGFVDEPSPLARSVGPTFPEPEGYRDAAVVIHDGGAGTWDPSELLDGVVSSAPPSPEGAYVPRVAVTMPGRRPMATVVDDPWLDGAGASTVSEEIPASLDDATIVPRGSYLDAASDDEGADAEPNTIVPRLMPRDRGGRLAFEPTVAVEHLSSDLLVDGSGEIPSVDEPDDLVLHTGDFESYDEPPVGEPSEVTTMARAPSLREPTISVVGSDIGGAEDLLTDPNRSYADLGFPGGPEDLLTDPQRSLASLGAARAFVDESATAHFAESSRRQGPSPDSTGESPASAWPAADVPSLVPSEDAVPSQRTVVLRGPSAEDDRPSRGTAVLPGSVERSEPSHGTAVLAGGIADTGQRRAGLAKPLPSLDLDAPEAGRRESTAVLGPPAYKPKSLPPQAPAWQSDADGEERALHDEGRWEDLCELLLSRLELTQSPVPRARMLLRLAGVLEDRLDDPQQAFDGLLEAYGTCPEDTQIVERLEGLARKLQRFPALIEVTMDRLGAARPSERIALLANAIRWYEGPIGKREAASFYVSELERADPSHPLLLVRKARDAKARGDHAGYLELLLRALERTPTPKERLHLHLAVGEAHRIPTEAFRHFEAAIEIDPRSLDALSAFERAALRFDRYPEVEWALRQLVEHAEGQARVDAYLRLADLLEKRFLKREDAAAVLRELLAIVPDHAGAYASLERCYLALRDYPRLVEAAIARAERSFGAKERGEAFAVAAEIAETKLGDQVTAAEHLRRAVLSDPTNEGLLARAAKLAERMQDGPALVEYRSRLAELLTEPHKQAQQYLAIAAQVDDPLERRRFYERAASADPSCAQAWEALEKLARELGDARSLVSALRHRIEATESQRQKAHLGVELGRELERLGDHEGAIEAFDVAFRADPSNERAAAAILDVLVAEGRYAEALPACELLVTAAARDRDGAVLYQRLRNSAKIAIGIGDLQKALGACVAAMDAAPGEAQPLVDVVEILERSEPEIALGPRADAAIGRVLDRSHELEADELAKLGKLLFARGEIDRAIVVLTRVLEGGDPSEADVTGQRPVPTDGRALYEVLGDAYAARGDYREAADMKIRLARVTPDADTRYAVLVSAIELIAHKMADLVAARPVVEEALEARPDDHWLLHTAMWLYGELDEWERLADVLERIVGVQETPERRAKGLFSLAQVVGDKIGDRARAAALYDETLDADKTRLDAFEALTRMLDELGDYAGLEKAYRKMIARVRDDGDDELVFTLFRNLAKVYSDKLDDPDLAQKALEGAKRMRPEDTSVKGAAVELLVARDELDRAVEVLRRDLERDPYDRKSYELLYGVLLRQSRFDRALVTAQVLADLRTATPEESQFLSDYPPIPLGQVPGSLVEEAWASHLYHRDLDEMATSIFAWITPAVCRMQESLLRPEDRVAAIGMPLTRKHTRLADAVTQAFHDAGEILVLSAPTLLVGRTSGSVPFTAAKFPYGALFASPEALSGVEGTLSYLVGKHMAEQRSEISARAFFPSQSELTSLLATAVRIARGDRADDAATQKLDRALSAVLGPEERAAITQAVGVAEASGKKLDVRAWTQAADLSSMRVGLLLAQDVRIAKKAILREPQSPSDLTPREKVGRLYLFATSELYADLRQAIGVNLADGGPADSAMR